jgi:acetolactate synthase I/II/III large subunit
MADGFARVSGRIPVVFCQNGPAAAIMVAPFAEAMKAGIPIVALVQEIELRHLGKNAFQEFDHQALFAPVTKWFRRLETADRIEDHIDAAFVAAGSGRPGPVVLMLPVDIQTVEAGCIASRNARIAARKRAILGLRWFKGNCYNSFGMNGGDDGTRTRGLCRDRAAF